MRNGQRDELCSLCSARRALRKEKGGLGWDGNLQGVHERRRAASGRDCRRVDELAGDHSGGMGVGRTVSSRRSTVYSFE